VALTRDSLLDYLANEMALDISTVDDDTPLFSSSLLDSFSMVDLMMFIETSAAIKMDPTEVNLDNLDTMQSILSFASNKAES
jgi:acyl carrier protein